MATYPEVSILMSLYNESNEQIEAAVESILEQTYRNFEFIIINDNPENQRLETLSHILDETDKRIKIIYNKKNLGLALSMNKAAAIAKGKYLARMDADDIAHKERIQQEVEQLDSGADLAYTNYYIIDENGKKLNAESTFYRAHIAKQFLSLKNCIVHSSVMIKSDFFKKLNGYRNFPCSQDYDLWLRAIENNAKLASLSRKLMSYRTRANSISASMPMKQDLTANYIRQLHYKRLQGKKDNFSISHYQSYLHRNGFNNKKAERKYTKYKALKDASREKFKDGHKLIGIIGYTQSFLANKIIRRSIITDWKIRKMIMRNLDY